MENASNTPSLRFRGYTDAWGQEAFEDIASRKSDAGISSQDLPSVEYEDIISDDGILNKDVRGKQTGKRGILFEEGDVLYGKLRPYLHNWLKPSFNGVVVGDFWVLQPHENIDVGFLYTLIKSPMFDSVANLSSGSKMPRADWNLVSSSAFSVPSNKEEQHKIGKLFGTLDDSISLHQR
ncbi:MAG: restriction endonuclease subunit S, partial [Candidatus Enterosoma sp.]|nr:restriction endonuclease subunit S [Candidatus Enterosoma sp.]